MKIVINKSYGRFNLSDAAMREYEKRTGQKSVFPEDILRNDPRLIAIVEEMGEAAYAGYDRLKIVEIPDDVEWEICDSGGYEWVAEKHRTWS